MHYEYNWRMCHYAWYLLCLQPGLAQLILRSGSVVREGDWLSIDGSTGEVFTGRLELVVPGPSAELCAFLGHAARLTRMRVRANADSADDAIVAMQFGASGIGCV